MKACLSLLFALALLAVAACEVYQDDGVFNDPKTNQYKPQGNGYVAPVVDPRRYDAIRTFLALGLPPTVRDLYYPYRIPSRFIPFARGPRYQNAGPQYQDGSALRSQYAPQDVYPNRGVRSNNGGYVY